MSDRNSDGTSTSGKSEQRMRDASQITDMICSLIDRCVEFHREPYSSERDQLTEVIVAALENAESRAIEP